MYANENSKISQYIRARIKIITRKFHIFNPRVFELFTRKVCEMFIYKHTETIEYVKN